MVRLDSSLTFIQTRVQNCDLYCTPLHCTSSGHQMTAAADSRPRGDDDAHTNGAHTDRDPH